MSIEALRAAIAAGQLPERLHTRNYYGQETGVAEEGGRMFAVTWCQTKAPGSAEAHARQVATNERHAAYIAAACNAAPTLLAQRDELLAALVECADRLGIHMKHSEDLIAHMKAHKAINNAKEQA